MGVSVLVYALLSAVGFYAAYKHPRVKYYTKFFLFCSVISLGSLYYALEFTFRGRDFKNAWRFKKVFWLTGRIIGLNPVLRGKQHLTPDRPCIYVANHQSCIDVISLVDVWPERCTIVSKASMKFAGPVGLITWLCKLIYIDRSKHRDAISAMKKAAEEAVKEQVSVYVFPEGTRSDNTKLLPFKKGAFYLAIECQFPIQPVVISPYSSFLDHKNKRFDDASYYVQALPQISTQGLDASSVEELMNKTQQKMQDCFDSLRTIPVALQDSNYN
ncbi:unnamed protein product [Calicophoron daubneyi]|uniref:1-acyl-sn-glycerol-3-phosphate acyltransferase n=1 Tax=Calicophoron daubneyi TaxID=300641 RepID=A0AAV2T4G6_CALDB